MYKEQNKKKYKKLRVSQKLFVQVEYRIILEQQKSKRNIREQKGSKKERRKKEERKREERREKEFSISRLVQYKYNVIRRKEKQVGKQKVEF